MKYLIILTLLALTGCTSVIGPHLGLCYATKQDVQLKVISLKDTATSEIVKKTVEYEYCTKDYCRKVSDDADSFKNTSMVSCDRFEYLKDYNEIVTRIQILEGKIEEFLKD